MEAMMAVFYALLGGFYIISALSNVRNGKELLGMVGQYCLAETIARLAPVLHPGIPPCYN